MKMKKHTHILKEIQRIMIKNKYTLSVAESITSGNLQAALGSISGASNYFKGGITAYSINEKVKILKVNFNEAKRTNCVSQKVANQMAIGVSKLFETSISLSTTGYAEKYKEENIKIPYAHYTIFSTIKNKNGVVVKKGIISGGKKTRNKVQEFVTLKVLEELLEYLNK